MKKDLFSYDFGDDSLTFLNSEMNAQYTENTGLVLLSFSKDKHVVAMQLMGVHKNFNIPKKVLENLKRAKIQFRYHKDKKSLIINIRLYYDNERPMVIVNTVNVTSMNQQDSEMTAIACA
jgi:hypothetical protein